jgi:hypothetical protein
MDYISIKKRDSVAKSEIPDSGSNVLSNSWERQKGFMGPGNFTIVLLHDE